MAARVLAVTRIALPRSRVFTWRRAAWFTASPTIVYTTRSLARMLPATMSPVQMPMPALSRPMPGSAGWLTSAHCN